MYTHNFFFIEVSSHLIYSSLSISIIIIKSDSIHNFKTVCKSIDTTCLSFLIIFCYTTSQSRRLDAQSKLNPMITWIHLLVFTFVFRTFAKTSKSFLFENREELHIIKEYFYLKPNNDWPHAEFKFKMPKDFFRNVILCYFFYFKNNANRAEIEYKTKKYIVLAFLLI